MRRLRHLAYTALCLMWFVLVTLPAWVLYVATLGAVSLEFFFYPNANWIEITIPGWSKNTFTYGIPAWRPF